MQSKQINKQMHLNNTLRVYEEKCVLKVLKFIMNEIVYCYSVKLYIIHNIDMVHIIVDSMQSYEVRTVPSGQPQMLLLVINT